MIIILNSILLMYLIPEYNREQINTIEKGRDTLLLRLM